jgi:hypothetical protein
LTPDPSEASELEALSIPGETFNALLQPFINVKLLLSEQIQSLIKSSHLLCALCLQNGTSFMSNQLYSDFQTMVKNAVLLVPKTRLINGCLKVYICLLGDDVLEVLFGRLAATRQIVMSANSVIVLVQDRTCS